MKKPKCFFVISRFNEDASWIKKYTNNYIIYNKGKELLGLKAIKRPNFGGNQFDIFHFIYNNYHHLPNLMAFVQANPFDHCKKEVFDKLICQEKFTPLEYYGNTPANSYEKRDLDGGFLEINNSWYLEAHNKTIKEKGYKITCPFKNFNQYMNEIFENYDYPKFIRFAPGSQYLVEKERCLYYPKGFWKHIMDIFPKDQRVNGGIEAHIIERSLWLIFNNIYASVKDLI